jgi:hypothetical protein
MNERFRLLGIGKLEGLVLVIAICKWLSRGTGLA